MRTSLSSVNDIDTSSQLMEQSQWFTQYGLTAESQLKVRADFIYEQAQNLVFIF